MRRPRRPDRVDGRTREEEAEHQFGPDALDGVAIDQGVVTDGHASLGSGTHRQSDVAQHQELAGWPGQRASGIEAGQRREVALEGVRPRLEMDAVPGRMDRDPWVVVGDRDEDVVTGDRERAGRARLLVVQALPGSPIEAQRTVFFERIAHRARTRERPACHAPARVGIDSSRHVRPLGVGRVSTSQPASDSPRGYLPARPLVPGPSKVFPARTAGSVPASGDAGAGDAVGSWLECDLEQVGEDLVGVRPTLVRDDRDGDPLVGHPADGGPGAEVATGVPECRVAGDQRPTGPRARTRRTACTAPSGRHRRPSRLASPARAASRRTAPAPSARGRSRWTRSNRRPRPR